MQRFVLASAFAMLVGLGCATKTVVADPTTDTDSVLPDSGDTVDPTPVPPLDAGDVRCSAEDVSTFEPEWRPPTPSQHACTDEQVVAITPCALGNGTQAECARFLAGGTAEDLACTRCVAGPSTGATWGATVHTPDKQIFLNTGGCIALLEPARTDCGKAADAAAACVHAACYATCFSDTTTSPDAQVACSQAASLGGCQEYVNQDVLCASAIGDAKSPALTCHVNFDEAGFRAIARVFCGPQ